MTTNLKLRAWQPQRVIILRALQLGDLLCAVPAFRALRAALPEAVITLVGLPWSQAFVERFNFYLDDFIEFPGYPGFPERTPQLDRFPKFLSDVQWLNFDLALQMHGSGGISIPLIELFGARHSAGFYQPGQYHPENGLFMAYPEDEPEVRRHLKLIEFLGAELQGEELEFPLYAQDWQEFEHLKRVEHLQEGEYICIHAGARAVDRRWPAERFAVLADVLAERGHQVVLTGSQDELPIVRQVMDCMHTRPINVAGQTSLGTLGALLSCARLVVSNDTGVSHVSDALRTPSVILFSASEPQRWAPLDRRLHRVIEQAPAQPTEFVLAEVEDLLQKERSYACSQMG